MQFKEIVILGEIFEIQYGDVTVRTKLQEIVSDREFIVLQPTLKGVPVRPEEQHVKFTFYRPNGCHCFDAELFPPYEKDNIMLCRAVRVSEVKRIQRRQCYRLPIMLDANLYEMDEIGEPLDMRCRAQTRELSEKSVSLSCFTSFEEDTPLAVEIHLSETETVMLRANVLQCNKPLTPTDPYEIVLVFTDNHEKNSAFLRRYIFKRQIMLRKKER